MKKLITNIILILTLVFTLNCTSSKGQATAKKVLEGQGYTEIEFTGWSPFSCSEDDTFSDGFTAKNKKGTKVSGVACSSLIVKSVTIRWN